MTTMREPILVVNAGSSSIKFSVFETMSDRSLAAGVHGEVAGIGTSPQLEITDPEGSKLTAKGIRRYGFHGLSYEYIVSVLPEILPESPDQKLIVAHLGNGASMCAIERGRSIATTMGFTALDGLPMGTRTGALDPGVILYLLQHERMTPDEIERLLYRQSGLLGVSGLSIDMRILLEIDMAGAREAVDLFVYRIGRELGSLAAARCALDVLVFTARIGE